MAFQIPEFNKIPLSNRDPDLRTFLYEELAPDREVLGRGSFGVVYKTEYKGSVIVVKELLCKEWSQSGKKFIKEAKIINILRVAERVIHPRFASEKLKVNH